VHDSKLLLISGFASQNVQLPQLRFHRFAKAAAKVLKLPALADILRLLSVRRALSCRGFWHFFGKSQRTHGYLWPKYKAL
jgi:hypothetical protein